MTTTKVYQFTLMLKNVNENTPGLEDCLYEAGCDDAIIHFRNNAVYLEFDRESASLEDAVISAIKDVRSAQIIIDIAGVSPENLVSESEIAKRLGKSRQVVSLWIKGNRRESFPSPVMRVSEKSPLWNWSEVAKWLYEKNIISDYEVVENALFIAGINGALEESDIKIRDYRHQLLDRISNNDRHLGHI